MEPDCNRRLILVLQSTEETFTSLAEPHTPADMGKPKGNSSLTRSPWGSGSQSGRSIPKIFRTQPRKAPASSRAYSGTARSSSLSPSGRHQAHSPLPNTAADQPLNRDLRSVAEDIKATLATAIPDLRMDLHSMTMHMDEIEETTMRNQNAIHQLQTSSQANNVQLRDMHRYMKDLDNCG